MKKRTIAKTGATMLTMAMLLNGTTVFAAAGTNYGATIEGEKQLLLINIWLWTHRQTFRMQHLHMQ